MFKKFLLLSLMLSSVSWAQTIDEALYEKGMDGDLDAMVAIGKIYAEQRHKENAQIWLRRAALLNHPEAQYLMAMQLRFDDQEAYENWLEKSVAQHYAPAQVEMAEHYFEQGTDDYDEKGLALLNAAVAKKEGKGLMVLGQSYILGMHGLKVDPQKGRAYLKQSADQGFMGAYYYLGKYYMKTGTEHNSTEALHWFEKILNEANEGGYLYRLATVEIANMHILGLGMPKDIQKGKEILKPVMSMYMPTSLYNMGLIYAQSEDEKERKKSLGYLRTACWQGIQESCDKVQDILGANHEK